MLRTFTLSLIAALIISFSASANTLQMAEDLIEEAIYDNEAFANSDSEIEIRLLKGRSDLEKSITEELELTSIDINTEKRSFSGFILSSNTIPLEISGKYTEIVEIPSVNRKVSRNEVISGADIQYIGIDSEKLERGYVTNEADLIGKSPTRTLFKSRPVMPSQIASPTIIKKKQTVTMLFKNNLLEMQDIGVAMEDGGDGELIRIRNENSNIIVNARVIGSNLVEVETGRQSLAYNN